MWRGVPVSDASLGRRRACPLGSFGIMQLSLLVLKSGFCDENRQGHIEKCVILNLC